MPAAFRIEHRLGIPAPASVIWQALADLESWGSWNPLYTRAEGELRIGEPLSVLEQLPGRDSAGVTYTVVDWVPDNQLLLQAKESAGFVRRVRYLEIEKLTDASSIFSNGEDWWGRLAGWVPRSRRRALRQGFEAMSHALSERATLLWKQQGGTPTSGA